jgi:hypothetical protein
VVRDRLSIAFRKDLVATLTKTAKRESVVIYTLAVTSVMWKSV